MNDTVAIDFAEYGRVFLPVYIKPYENTVMEATNFKVDTGADFTTVSKKILYSLGYDYDWITQNALTGQQYNLSTAAGDMETVGIIQLPLISLLGYEAAGWPFRILMEPKRDFRNLMGRDILAGFDYTFRNSRQTFEISRIGRFSPLFPFLPGQSIHELV